MLRRLLFALLAIGAIGTALTFGAMAYFSDSASGGVTITAGDAELNLDYDDDCDTVWEVSGVDTFSITWSGIVPGDTETDCVRIHNVGDGALDVYVLNNNFGGADLSLLNDLRFQVRNSGGGVICPYATPNSAQYTSGKGCFVVNELAAGSSYQVLLDSWFVDTGSDQNALEGDAVTWDTSIDGYTD